MCCSLETALGKYCGLETSLDTLEASLDTLERCSHKALVDSLEIFLEHSGVQMSCMSLEALDKNLVGMNSLGSHIAFLPSPSQQDMNIPPLHDQEIHNRSKVVKKQHY